MDEKIVKEFVTLSYNKYGELVETTEPQRISIDVEYDDLNPMCRDFLKMLKDDNVFSFSITTVDSYSSFEPKIARWYYDLINISKIEFKEYYLMINDTKIFYNAIFDFAKARRW